MTAYRVTIDGHARPNLFWSVGRPVVDFSARPKYRDQHVYARVTVVVSAFSPADAVSAVARSGVNYHPDSGALSLRGGLGIDSVSLSEWSLVSVRQSRAAKPVLTPH